MSKLNEHRGVGFCAQARVHFLFVMSGAGTYYERISREQLTLMNISADPAQQGNGACYGALPVPFAMDRSGRVREGPN